MRPLSAIGAVLFALVVLHQPASRTAVAQPEEPATVPPGESVTLTRADSGVVTITSRADQLAHIQLGRNGALSISGGPIAYGTPGLIVQAVETREADCGAARYPLRALACAVGYGAPPALVVFRTVTPADPSLLRVTVTTDRQAYAMGAPVTVTVAATNPTGTPIVTYGSSSCTPFVTVTRAADGAVVHGSGRTIGCTADVSPRLFPPGETILFTNV